MYNLLVLDLLTDTAVESLDPAENQNLVAVGVDSVVFAGC